MADEDWESVDVSRINLKPAEKPSAQGKASSARPNSLVAAIEEATAAAAAAAVVGEDSLDPALREALQGGGADRQAALRFDAECERLILAPKLQQHTLPGPLGNYHRMLARKVAKHYQLLCDSTLEDGICLTKTERSRPPLSRLQDVPVVSDSDRAAAASAEAAAQTPGGTAEPPRVVKGVMRRNASSSNSLGGAGMAGGAGQAPQKTVEEREAEYERARERILGRTSDADAAPDAAASASTAGVVDAPSFATALPLNEAGAPGPDAGGQRTRTSSARALLRDREKDLADPDFVRGGYSVPMAPGYSAVPMPWPPGLMPGSAYPPGDFPPLGGAPVGGAGVRWNGPPAQQYPQQVPRQW